MRRQARGTGRTCRRSGTSPPPAPPNRSRGTAAGLPATSAWRRSRRSGDSRRRRGRRRRHARDRCAWRGNAGATAFRTRSFSPSRLQLEFREVVLPHELENPFNVREIHPAPFAAQLSSGRPDASSDIDPSGRVLGPHIRIGHEHVVFDPDTADAGHVCARLDRENHSRLDDSSGSPGASRAIRGSSCTSSPRP